MRRPAKYFVPSLMVLLLVLGLAAVCSGCGQAGSGTASGLNSSAGSDGMETGEEDEMTYRQMTMDEALKEMEGQDDYILLDVRRQDEYAGGHIPGAVLLPNESIPAGAASDEAAAAAVGEVLPDSDQTIYVYCRSGNRSKQASAKLVALGYTNITEIGGINSYTGELEY